jgi:hypothetical protein
MGFNWIYSILLRLYPREYRMLFASEMTAVIAAAITDRWNEGRLPFISFALREVTGVVEGAGREQIAKLAHSLSHTSSYINGRGLPDRLLMRPAGIAWESYYGLFTTSALTQEATGGTGPCVNAYQRFAFGSTLRRLLILSFGTCRCGQAPL